MITIHVLWRIYYFQQKYNLFIYIQQEVNNDLLDFRHDYFFGCVINIELMFCFLSITGHVVLCVVCRLMGKVHSKYILIYPYMDIYMVWRLRQKPHHHRTYFQTLSACEMGQYLRDQSTSVLYRRNEWVSKWWESTEISSHTTHIVYSIFSRVLSRYSSDIYISWWFGVCVPICIFVERNGNSPCQVENTQDVLYICCTFVRSNLY